MRAQEGAVTRDPPETQHPHPIQVWPRRDERDRKHERGWWDLYSHCPQAAHKLRKSLPCPSSVVTTVSPFPKQHFNLCFVL